mmetsp:Transcript_6027/g.13122  ORF Transcript_6027/g.13122 Transcript_6027/m.13122 type:complete len:87 (-) Transcript_6027:112-372(-)
MVGVDEGTSVGTELGVSDKDMVGVYEGLELGLDVGDVDGISLAEALGMDVGGSVVMHLDPAPGKTMQTWFDEQHGTSLSTSHVLPP